MLLIEKERLAQLSEELKATKEKVVRTYRTRRGTFEALVEDEKGNTRVVIISKRLAQ